MSSPGLTGNLTATPNSTSGSLINAAPGMTTPPDPNNPAQAPTGAESTGATPAPATSIAPPPATGYNPAQTAVQPNQTVAGNIKDIIASGSPLMEQAETNAKNMMNQRGLINSSQAITAGQSALYAAATPIATADAARYGVVADSNTVAKNAALQFTAGAQNAANIENLHSSTSLTSQQMQDETQKNLANTNSELQTYLGQLQSNTTLTAQERQDATQSAIASANNVNSTALANIQSSTTLTAQDKANASAQVIASANNTNAIVLANIQSNTALSVTDKQTQSAQVISNAQIFSAEAIAHLQADTTLTAQDRQNETQKVIQASQVALQTYLGQLSSSTTLTAQDKQNASQAAISAANNANAKIIADIQSNTTLAAQDKQDQTNIQIQASQATLQTYLGNLSSQTTLSAQDKAAEAQKAVASMNNVSAQIVAGIQANTSLSVEDKQTQSAQIIARMNNEASVATQKLVNEGALANIAANGVVNTQIQQMTNDNKTLLQTSAGASQLYTQVLQAMSGIMTNKDLTQEQKTTALNNSIAQLNDGLAVMAKIAGIPGIASTLNFSTQGGGGGTGSDNATTVATGTDGNGAPLMGTVDPNALANDRGTGSDNLNGYSGPTGTQPDGSYIDSSGNVTT